MTLQLRILGALALGPATTRQLATMLSRTYDWTHQNVLRLERRGKIVCCGEGRGHPVGRLAKVYRLKETKMVPSRRT